jgi:carbamoyltransferase
MNKSDIYILGISCYFHDSAAALIKNGEIIAAAQEERFTRIKNDANFPCHAIRYCLEEGNVTINELHKIIFYEKPELKFKRIIKSGFCNLPKGAWFLLNVVPSWLFGKLHWKRNLSNEIKKHFNVDIGGELLDAVEHHRSHAASAFHPSNFEEAAVLVVDGVGEFDTVSIWHGKDNKINKVFEIHFPDSLGLLYSAFTLYTGFKVNSGEYKVMGLAPYGEPAYVKLIKDNLIKINEDGSFKLNQEYFTFTTSKKMFNDKFMKLLGGPCRQKDSLLTQRDMDLARSIQEITNEILVKLAKKAKQITGAVNLCMAGGVALNCVANGCILKEKIFDEIWIQPAAGDAGASIGAALSYYYAKNNEDKKIKNTDKMKGALLGPSFSSEKVKRYLDSVNAKYVEYENSEKYLSDVAKLISSGNIIGWHQGRMEFGPRALGARSILGDARNIEMQSTMNLKIKFRESFRPFAPSVLREDVDKYFDLNSDSPYMMIVSSVKNEICIKESTENLFGIDRLKKQRSQIPSVTHVDYSARIQTVSPQNNLIFYKLISQFKAITNCSVLINTSFNVRGEPIVCTPEDSYRCFMRTGIDVLAIENFILFKNEQPVYSDKSDWRDEFKND